jgi:hypothetical protein
VGMAAALHMFLYQSLLLSELRARGSLQDIHHPHNTRRGNKEFLRSQQRTIQNHTRHGKVDNQTSHINQCSDKGG